MPNRAGDTAALSTVTQVDAENGTSTTVTAWTAQRVGQAIAAQSLTKTNVSVYTPSQDYHPATKKYVDDSLSGVSVPNLTLTELTLGGFRISYNAGSDSLDFEVV